MTTRLGDGMLVSMFWVRLVEKQRQIQGSLRSAPDGEAVRRSGRGDGFWVMRLLAVLLVTGGAFAQTAAKPVAARAGAAPAAAASGTVQVGAAAMSAQEMMTSLIAHEQESMERRNRYTYMSTERSDRTGGHAWTERVVETPQGKIRRLLAVDGVPLTAEQESAERGRLAEILKDPEPFIKREAALRGDEQHAKQMVDLLGRAFLFDNMRQEGAYIRIGFQPNPAFQPQSLEERVLRGMIGSVLIDPKLMRLHKIEARLPEDVTIGFGLVATIHAGTNLSTTREPVESGEWKTTVIDTHIDGKALFFKSLSRSEQAEHTEFHRVANDLTLVQAVAMVEQ